MLTWSPHHCPWHVHPTTMCHFPRSLSQALADHVAVSEAKLSKALAEQRADFGEALERCRQFERREAKRELDAVVRESAEARLLDLEALRRQVSVCWVCVLGMGGWGGVGWGRLDDNVIQC